VSNDIRRERIAGEIKKIVSDIIANEVRDPAVPPFISVVSVEISADMSYAKIRVSTLGSPEKIDGAVEALKRAAGFVRRELGQKLTIRHVPQVIFVADHGIEHSIAIQETLKKIHDEQGGRDDAAKNS
jgi:ribosome-binding factor A